MHQILFFFEKFDCIFFYILFFPKKENGNIWKYLEIKKPQKKPNCNKIISFITIIVIFLFILIM
jgi:hypothetical protein